MADAPTPAPEATPTAAPLAPTEDVVIKPDPAVSEPEESTEPDEVRGSPQSLFNRAVGPHRACIEAKGGGQHALPSWRD